MLCRNKPATSIASPISPWKLQSLLIYSLLLLTIIQPTRASIADYLQETGLIDWNDLPASLYDLFFRRRRLPCAIKFLIMQYTSNDPLRYSDKYRSDSVMILSESGQYVGPEDITEYLGFVYEDTSPFVQEGPVHQEQRLRIIGYDATTGQCELHRYAVSAYALNPELTGHATKASIALLNSLFLDDRDMYLTRVNIYYPKSFLHWYFGEQFNTEPVKDFVCSEVLAGSCAGRIGGVEGDAFGDDLATCHARLDALPAATGDAYVDGDSLGCRVLHAAFARSNPDGHCAHVSLDTTDPDRNGQVKCSRSAGVEPSDLFDEETLEEFDVWVRVRTKMAVFCSVGISRTRSYPQTRLLLPFFTTGTRNRSDVWIQSDRFHALSRNYLEIEYCETITVSTSVEEALLSRSVKYSGRIYLWVKPSLFPRCILVSQVQCLFSRPKV